MARKKKKYVFKGKVYMALSKDEVLRQLKLPITKVNYDAVRKGL